MCPVCLATAMLIAASVTSTGGLATMAVKKFGVKEAVENSLSAAQSKEDRRG